MPWYPSGMFWRRVLAGCLAQPLPKMKAVYSAAESPCATDAVGAQIPGVMQAVSSTAGCRYQRRARVAGKGQHNMKAIWSDQFNCYFGGTYLTSPNCTKNTWQCQTCGEWFCSYHWHETDLGHCVECAACERERLEGEA